MALWGSRLHGHTALDFHELVLRRSFKCSAVSGACGCRGWGRSTACLDLHSTMADSSCDKSAPSSDEPSGRTKACHGEVPRATGLQAVPAAQRTAATLQPRKVSAMMGHPLQPLEGSKIWWIQSARSAQRWYPRHGGLPPTQPMGSSQQESQVRLQLWSQQQTQESSAWCRIPDGDVHPCSAGGWIQLGSFEISTLGRASAGGTQMEPPAALLCPHSSLPQGSSASPAGRVSSSGFISFTHWQGLILLVTSTSFLNPNQCSKSPRTSQCLINGFLWESSRTVRIFLQQPGPCANIPSSPNEGLWGAEPQDTWLWPVFLSKAALSPTQTSPVLMTYLASACCSHEFPYFHTLCRCSSQWLSFEGETLLPTQGKSRCWLLQWVDLPNWKEFLHVSTGSNHQGTFGSALFKHTPISKLLPNFSSLKANKGKDHVLLCWLQNFISMPPVSSHGLSSNPIS